MPINDRGIVGDRWFPSTSWSLILGAQTASPDDYARQMTRLAENYWRPVYWFIRNSWRKGHDDAKDLTQEFFATVIFDRKLVDGYAHEGSGFRAFLRAAISRFMVDKQRRAERQKRGGGLVIDSLDVIGEVSTETVPDGSIRTPEQMFDIAWKEAVMKDAMGLLLQRLTADGREAEFQIFKRYDYEGGSAELSYEQLAASVGMTVPQVRHALSNARQAFRRVVTDIVSGYAETPAELDAELQALFGV